MLQPSYIKCLHKPINPSKPTFFIFSITISFALQKTWICNDFAFINKVSEDSWNYFTRSTHN